MSEAVLRIHLDTREAEALLNKFAQKVEHTDGKVDIDVASVKKAGVEVDELKRKVSGIGASGSTSGLSALKQTLVGTFGAGTSSVASFALAASGGLAVAGGAVLAFGAQSIETFRSAEASAIRYRLAIEASERDFGKQTGSLKEWDKSVQKLRQSLRVYSEEDIQVAIAGTVNMTKRLELNQVQMEKIIEVAGNLGVGQFKIAESSERISAAMRGEAEAAEALGLTLSESAVKNFALLNGETERSWAVMDEATKAHYRFLLMLEQAAQKMNDASAYADSHGGRIDVLTMRYEKAKVAAGGFFLELVEGLGVFDLVEGNWNSLIDGMGYNLQRLGGLFNQITGLSWLTNDFFRGIRATEDAINYDYNIKHNKNWNTNMMLPAHGSGVNPPAPTGTANENPLLRHKPTPTARPFSPTLAPSTAQTQRPKTPAVRQPTPLEEIAGMGEREYKKLAQSGIRSLDALSKATDAKLVEISKIRNIHLDKLHSWRQRVQDHLSGITTEQRRQLEQQAENEAKARRDFAKTLIERNSDLEQFKNTTLKYMYLRAGASSGAFEGELEASANSLRESQIVQKEINDLLLEREGIFDRLKPILEDGVISPDEKLPVSIEELNRYFELEKEISLKRLSLTVETNREFFALSRAEHERKMSEFDIETAEIEKREIERISQIKAVREIRLGKFVSIGIDTTDETRRKADIVLQQDLLNRKKERLEKEFQFVKFFSELEGNERIAALNSIKEQMIQAEKEITVSIEDEVAARKAIRQQEIDMISDTMQGISQRFIEVGQIAQTFEQLKFNSLKKRFDYEQKTLNEALEGEKKRRLEGALTERQREMIETDIMRKKEANEARLQAKYSEQMRRSWIAKQVAAVGEIVFGTASNVVKAFPNPFLMALAGGLGLAQTAEVLSAKPPEFAMGGEVFGGRQIIQVNEEGREFVMNATATRQFKPELELMNKGKNSFDSIVSELREVRRLLGKPTPQPTAILDRYYTPGVLSEGRESIIKKTF